MGYRKLVGTFAEVTLEQELFPLPNNHIHLLREAVKLGRLHAPTFRRRETLMKEHTFDEQWRAFKDEALHNSAFAHLLMACYLMKICEDIGKMRTRNSNERIYFHLLALTQYELTHACMLLNEKNLRYLPSRYERIGIDERIWLDRITGAMTAVRVMRLFRETHARLYLTVPIVDCEWKIDLVVRWPGKQRGLCVQIETNNLEPNAFGYTAFKHVEAKDLADRENPHRKLLIGVDRFRERNRGNWIPVLIRLAANAYKTEAIDSPENVRVLFLEMLAGIDKPYQHEELATVQL